ncbi:MAG: adenylyltransferase/cytidyltransferase family protein [Candidatus Peribacteraceae bacterium]|nr:adenylyltransferase/cytidyltransferase family protein [Candidatus Peribacteraceae bacterium]
MRTGVFIGRFQPFHEGHRRCVDHILEECGHCIIMLRDTPATEKNPFDFEKRAGMIRAQFSDESKVSIVRFEDRDAELAVYIGRDVGYELIQLDAATESISATDVRRKLYREAGKEFDPRAPQKVK